MIPKNNLEKTMTTTDDEVARNERHQNRMARKKAVVDEKKAKAQEDKGVIVITTGNGKGKSSSGFGMVARSLGHGMKVGIVQFIKGAMSTGEEAFFRRFPDELDYFVMGEGFTWETQDRERDIEAVNKAWQKACEFLSNQDYDFVLLDELNIAIKNGYLAVEDVIKVLQEKPSMQHVVITGRGAKPELIELADTVTEMNVVKHAFKNGIRAQKGVEL